MTGPRPTLDEIVARTDKPQRPSLEEIVTSTETEPTGAGRSFEGAQGGYGKLARIGEALTNPQTAMEGLRGATFGFLDEAGAAGQALGERISGRTPDMPARYRELMAQSDTERNTYREEHPVAATLANVAGGVATGKAILPRSLGAVPNTASTLAKVGGSLKRIGAVSGIGATAGGLAGAGDPGEGETRMESARRGALTGGIVGGAVGTVGEVGTAGWQLLRRIFGKSLPGEVAERYAAEAGQTAADAQTRATTQAAQGKDPTFADALGRTGMRLGQDAGATSPQAADMLSEFGVQRTKPVEAGREIVRDLRASTGVTPKPTILSQRIIDRERRAMAEQVYPLLRQDTRPITDPEVLRAIDTDLGRQAYAMAARMARADATAAGVTRRAAVPFNRIFNEQGHLIEAPNLATLDWMKRGMDELLDVGTVIKPGQGASLSDTERAAVREIRTFLMQRLDALGSSNPTLKAYSQVRKEQESAFATVEALQQGFTRFKAATVAPGSVTDDLRRLEAEAAKRNLPPDLLRTAYQHAGLDATATRLRTGSLSKGEQAGMIQSLREMGVTQDQVDEFLTRLQTTQERQQVGMAFRRLLGGGDDPVVGNKGAATGDILTGNVAGGLRNVFKAAHNRFTGITPSTAPAIADVLRQPAAPGIAGMRRAEGELFNRRNRIETEALVSFLLGQQAGGQ